VFTIALSSVFVGGYGFAATPNYGEVLQKSIFFYEAQKSGKLPASNRINWRGDSALSDGQDVGVNLTGGFYDAGDHVKFGLPMAYSMTMLAWGAIAYPNAYVQVGEMDRLLSVLKWGTDFMIQAHPSPHVFYGQVGGGNTDHAWWGPAEVMKMARPSYKIDESHPGSDLAAESAAALAAVSILYKNVDSAYSAILIQHAKDLYEFADNFRGKYSDSITDAQAFYNSWSGYDDELVWGALWLYKATQDQTYLNKAIQAYSAIANAKQNWTLSWDDKSYGCNLLLAQITGASNYRARVEDWLDFWTTGTSNGKVQYTPGGLAWLDTWGSLRYASTTAFAAFMYSDYLDSQSLSSDKSQKYKNFALQQMNYILGSNPQNRSYVVGFGNNPPLNVHHRTAHGSWSDSIQDPPNNRHILYGALVGGPNTSDQYMDDRSNYQQTEVALDYNAGFMGAVAKMVLLYGGTPLSNFPVPETKGTEYFVSAKVNSSGPRYTEISALLNNQSAWPASAPAISYRYFVNLTEVFAKGYRLSDVTVTANYNQGSTVSPLTLYDPSQNTYYIEVSFPAGSVYPGGQSQYKKEVQFRISLPQNTNAPDWDPSNDWSYQGVNSSGYRVANNIPVYINGMNVFGSAPLPVDTGQLCVAVGAVDGLSDSMLQSVSAGSYTFTPNYIGQSVCQQVPVGTYSVTAPNLSSATANFSALPISASVTKGQTASISVIYTATQIPLGTLCLTVNSAQNLSFAALKPIQVGSYTFNVLNFGVSSCQQVLGGNYSIQAPALTSNGYNFVAPVITATVNVGDTVQKSVVYEGTPIINPSPSPSPTPTPTPSPSPTPVTGACTVKVSVGGAWQQGSMYLTAMNLFVQNNSSLEVNAPWTLTLTNPNYVAVQSSWNWNPIYSSGSITGAATSSWQSLQPNGASPVNLGMILGSSVNQFTPNSATLNGVSCNVVVQ
jgi:hypothetical protein